MVSFSMTLSGPNAGFKVTVYLQVEYLERCVLGTKLLRTVIHYTTYTIYRMVPLSMTLSDLWPRFQGHDRHFSTLNISETTRDRAIYSIERWHFQWPWRTRRPQPGFQGHGIFEVEYLKNGALRLRFSSDADIVRLTNARIIIIIIIIGTKLLKNTNRKPYTIYRMIPLIIPALSIYPVYLTLIGNPTQSIEWYNFQWPWVTSDPDFQVTTFLNSNIGKNGASYRQSYYSPESVAKQLVTDLAR